MTSDNSGRGRQGHRDIRGKGPSNDGQGAIGGKARPWQGGGEGEANGDLTSREKPLRESPGDEPGGQKLLRTSKTNPQARGQGSKCPVSKRDSQSHLRFLNWGR